MNVRKITGLLLLGAMATAGAYAQSYGDGYRYNDYYGTKGRGYTDNYQYDGNDVYRYTDGRYRNNRAEKRMRKQIRRNNRKGYANNRYYNNRYNTVRLENQAYNNGMANTARTGSFRYYDSDNSRYDNTAYGSYNDVSGYYDNRPQTRGNDRDYDRYERSTERDNNENRYERRSVQNNDRYDRRDERNNYDDRGDRRYEREENRYERRTERSGRDNLYNDNRQSGSTGWFSHDHRDREHYRTQYTRRDQRRMERRLEKEYSGSKTQRGLFRNKANDYASGRNTGYRTGNYNTTRTGYPAMNNSGYRNTSYDSRGYNNRMGYDAPLTRSASQIPEGMMDYDTWMRYRDNYPQTGNTPRSRQDRNTDSRRQGQITRTNPNW